VLAIHLQDADLCDNVRRGLRYALKDFISYSKKFRWV